MNKNLLPLRVGVGIALLNNKNKIFVIDDNSNDKSIYNNINNHIVFNLFVC